MASKERPTLHLKKNPDFPPKPPTEGIDFDPGEARRIANETLDDLKKELYASGISPGQVSSLWQQARLTHEKILNSLSDYRKTDNPEKKEELVSKIQQETATLKGEREENLREARQLLSSFNKNKKGRFKKDKATLPGHFDETLQTYMKSEARAYSMKHEAASPDTEAVLNEPDAMHEETDAIVDEDTKPEEVIGEMPVNEVIVEPEPVTETESALDEEQSIVMVNPVLTKIAMGGKKPKKPKETKLPKPKKSVSEGGTVYKGMEFSEREPGMEDAIGEEAMAEMAPDTGPEPLVIRGNPDSRAEFKSILRRSVEQINNELQAKQKIIKSLEETARHEHGAAADALEGQILMTENEVRALEKERSTVHEAATTVPANENAGEGETVEVPIVQEEDSQMEEHSYGRNVIDLQKRKERIEKKQAQKKRNFITAAVMGLFGLSTAAAGPNEKTPSPEKHRPVPAVSHAPGVVTRLQAEPAPIIGLHQNAPSPRSAPNPITLQRQQHAAEMAQHHTSNVRAEAVVRSHRAGSVDPDRSEEIAAIYAAEHAGVTNDGRPGLLPHTDPENFTAFRAGLRTAKERPVPAPVERSASGTDTQSSAAERSALSVPDHGVKESQHEQAPANLETAPPAHEETAPAPVVEESKNMHGLAIDKSVTHMYEATNGVLVAYGGSYEQQVKMTNDFLQKKKNYGRTVLVMTRTLDPMTGKPDVSSYSTDSSGQMQFRPVLADEMNLPLLPPTDDDLVKLVL